MQLDGTGFTVLHAFSDKFPNSSANSDGVTPEKGVIVSGTTLYGTARDGGTNRSGTVFKLNTDGTGFTVLRQMTESTDGAEPQELVLAGASVIGVTPYGGSANGGTIFKVNTDGSGFAVLRAFSSSSDNNVGRRPTGRLVLNGSTLYGVTRGGGPDDAGAIYRISTAGLDFTPLYFFNTAIAALPVGGLTLRGSTLFGFAQAGGSDFRGALYSIETSGTNFNRVASLRTSNFNVRATGEPVVVNNAIISTAYQGGNNGDGSVFKIVEPTTPLVVTTANDVVNPGRRGHESARSVRRREHRAGRADDRLQ